MANALRYVTTTETGFEGTLAMLSLSTPIRIIANRMKKHDSQPDFRVLAGGKNAEIGAGWMKTAQASGKDYMSLTLADPSIGPNKFYANLAKVKDTDDRFVLLWNPK